MKLTVFLAIEWKKIMVRDVLLLLKNDEFEHERVKFIKANGNLKCIHNNMIIRAQQFSLCGKTSSL